MRLKTHARTSKPESREPQGISPRRTPPRPRKTILPPIQRRQARSKRHPRLNQRAQYQPHPLARPDLVAYPTDERAEEEGEEGAEGLAVGHLEPEYAGVGAGEEAGDGEGELDGVAWGGGGVLVDGDGDGREEGDGPVWNAHQM